MACWARRLAVWSVFALGELVGNLEGVGWGNALFFLVVFLVGAVAFGVGSRQ
jgi:hypothetical protein